MANAHKSPGRESQTKASAVVSRKKKEKKKNRRRRLGSKTGLRKRNESIGGWREKSGAQMTKKKS